MIYICPPFFFKEWMMKESQRKTPVSAWGPPTPVFLQGDTVQSNNDMSSIFNFEYFSSLTKK